MTTVTDPLYFDTAATTPIAPEVLEAMVGQLGNPTSFANPSSDVHEPGRAAASVIATARADIAAELGGETDEVIFTSGATEANNLALRGVALAYADQGRHLITSQIEHKAVLACCAETGRRAARGGSRPGRRPEAPLHRRTESRGERPLAPKAS